jgi:hypothetical protein
MKRSEFIDKYKHRIAGFVCDAATAGRTGAELAVFLRHAMKQLDAEIGAMFDALQPEPVVTQTNGVHKADAQPARK